MAYAARRWVPTVVALVLSAGCQLPRFGAPDPASDEGRSVGGLWSGFFLAGLAVLALVWVLLAFVVIRYRRRPGDDELPDQRPYHIPLELAYTVIPVLIVAALFFFSVRTELEVTRVSARPAARVEVLGFQWSWQFRYQAHDGLPAFTVDGLPGEPPELVLPVGAPTNLRLVSPDVAHSFWVPDFLSKRDLIPGVRNEMTVTPDEVGSYTGRCAEFCGLDHWRMYFSVRVVSMAEYRAWAAERAGAS
ncbi:MAG: cytochrome c oxidase, subunit [Acidimicrobiales bacterium]|nr:cytochrome c oxidase, subunit [Acidimicrobiales bacterium]